MSVEVSLTVPAGREACVSWLQGHPPALVADLLDGVRLVHATAQATPGGEEDASAASLTALRSECDALREECDVLRGECERRRGLDAVRQGELQEAFDRRLEEQRVLYDRAQQSVVHNLREQYELRLASEAQHLQRLQTQMSELQDKTLSLFGGNSARKGDLGEDLVVSVHSELQLGTLTKTSRIRAAGYADATWEYAPPAPAPPLTGIVETKFGHHANHTRDVQKFVEDVREGAASGRVKVALYLSLVERVHGKPKLSFEMLHGVPVLWAGRSLDDDLSARSLIELSFVAMAHVWTHTAARDETHDREDTLRHLQAYLAVQAHECEKLEASLKIIERSGEAIRAQVFQLRTLRDRLLAETLKFRARHLPDDDTTPPAGELLAALRTFYAEKKRFPKTATEFQGISEDDYGKAVECIKREHYADAAQRRKRGKTGDA